MYTTMFEGVVDASEYMLRVANSPIGRMYKSLALSQLGLRPGNAVLDLGCGPGADLANYAEGVGSAGVVIGVDHDERAVSDAKQRTGTLPQVQVRLGDVQALEMPDASFDAVHTDRVLQHVPDPAAAMTEAARVLKVGGRAVFAEPDWRTLVIDHPDVRLAEAYTRYVNEHQVRNPRIGSQVSRLCHSVDLSVQTVIPITSVFDDPAAADQVLGFHRVTERVVQRGLMSVEDSQRWIEHLSRRQPFFASVTLFMVVALRTVAAVGHPPAT